MLMKVKQVYLVVLFIESLMYNYTCFDGIVFPKLLKKLTGIKTPRISFDMTSLAPKIFSYASRHNKTIYFIGSTEENISKFSRVFSLQYPKVKVKGVRNGFFSSIDERKTFVNDIKDVNPDIVIVGMGTPSQDLMISDLKKKLVNNPIYCCGGFFHQSSKGLHYYPTIFNRLNIRWIYRIIDEPKINYPGAEPRGIQRNILFYEKPAVFQTFPQHTPR